MTQARGPVHLVGPGGAGKTTTGALLAHRLGWCFFDLDAAFLAAVGDIGGYIDRHGYAAYAARSVATYVDAATALGGRAVVALSSGFMVYPPGVDPRYPALRERIASGRATFVLLPSLDREACVAETVRRQIARPFGRTPQREEAVIRSRFGPYRALPARKIETLAPADGVADMLARAVQALAGGAAQISLSS